MRKHNVLYFALFFMCTINGETQILDRPVAVVRLTETVSIGQNELKKQVNLLENQLETTLSMEQRREVLEAQIGDILLTQAAIRENIRISNDEIDNAIALQQERTGGSAISTADFRRLIQEELGISWSEYVEEVRNRLLQERYILNRSGDKFQQVKDPSEREILRVYEENAPDFTSPSMIRFDHLFFDTRETLNSTSVRKKAEEFSRQIQNNTGGFDSLLRKSLDDVTYSGGDFGYLIRGDRQATAQLGDEFMNAVFGLSIDTVSKVLESNAGFHIVRITDKRKPRLLELNDPILPGETLTVREQIKAAIMNNEQQRLFQQEIALALRELEEEAEITRYVDALSW